MKILGADIFDLVISCFLQAGTHLGEEWHTSSKGAFSISQGFLPLDFKIDKVPIAGAGV
jgi:hypothetical protein